MLFKDFPIAMQNRLSQMMFNPRTVTSSPIKAEDTWNKLTCKEKLGYLHVVETQALTDAQWCESRVMEIIQGMKK